MTLPEPPPFTPSSSVRAGERFGLRHRPDDGAELPVRFTKTINRVLTVRVNEIRIHSESSVDYSTRVIAANAEGMDIELSYQDHTYGNELPRSQGSADFAELIGRKVQARLSKTGKWSDFRGLDLLPEIKLPGERAPGEKTITP